MNTSLLQLYIARVELYHHKNFVADTLKPIGRVKLIDYIPKRDFNGNDYYSAIITFSTWIDSETTRELFQNMANNQKQTLFYYNDYKGNQRYWVIKEHIPSIIEGETQDDIDISNQTETYYYKLRNQHLEKQLQQLNATIITQTFQIDYLNERLDNNINEMALDKETLKYREYDLSSLQIYISSLKEDIKELNSQIKTLNQEVKDRDRIIDYYQNEHFN